MKGMGKYAAVATAVSICLAVAFGQNPEFTFDGKDWKVPPQPVKIAFVMGFTHGYSEGFEDGDSKNSRLEVGKYSNQQILDTMETVYGDYRNVSICWDDAEYLAVQSLSGHPAPEEMVSALRASAAKNGCVGK